MSICKYSENAKCSLNFLFNTNVQIAQIHRGTDCEKYEVIKNMFTYWLDLKNLNKKC